VSSGVQRHRLSRAGDRRLNYALHVMAMAQIKQATPGRDYYQRERAAGKTHKQAMACLKRRGGVVYRTMMTLAGIPHFRLINFPRAGDSQPRKAQAGAPLPMLGPRTALRSGSACHRDELAGRRTTSSPPAGPPPPTDQRVSTRPHLGQVENVVRRG
jgi:hypothetical protein